MPGAPLSNAFGGGGGGMPTPNFGSIVAGYQKNDNPLMQILQAASQFPQQQQQAMLDKMQVQMGQQQVKANNQAYDMNEQNMAMNQQQMKAQQDAATQQQLAMYGKLVMNNRSGAVDPTLIGKFQQLATQQGLSPNTYLTPDGKSVNLEMFKTDMPQEELSRLMQMPPKQRMAQINIDKQQFRIGGDTLHHLLNDPVQFDPVTAGNLAVLQSKAAEQATGAQKNVQEGNYDATRAAYEPMRAQAAVMAAQASFARAQASMANAQARLQAGNMAGVTTILSQLGTQSSAALDKFHSAQSSLTGLYTAYGVNPAAGENALATQISAKDPQHASQIIANVAKLQGDITEGMSKMQQLHAEAQGLMPYAQNGMVQQQLNSILQSTGGTATITTPAEKVYPMWTAAMGKPAKIKIVNGAQYGQMSDGKIYKLPANYSAASMVDSRVQDWQAGSINP